MSEHRRPGADPRTPRSREWFAGEDEVAVLHRVAMRSTGVAMDADDHRPVIGIADSASDLNPCNLPLAALVDAVRRGITAAGGIAVRFPVMSLGEDLMKPTAMLYRNLLAMEVEETLRANPLDGVVLLANCDKTVPGALMGAASADLPAVLVTGGARPAAVYRGRRLGTGTDLWRLWEDHRAGRLDDAGWAEVERCLSCGLGACNTMGTASTMAVLAETLGMALPGSATVPAGDPAAAVLAERAGRRAVELVREGLTPSAVLTPAAFRNAIAMLNAVGGSTNAIIHLAAIAGRLALDLAPEDFVRPDVPVLADVEPSGAGLVQDLHAAGGVPALVRELGPLLDQGAPTVAGGSLGEAAADAPRPSGVLRPLTDPLRRGGAFAVVRGSLAPDGAVIKVSAAGPELLVHRGPALVFTSYQDMRARIDDPGLDVTAATVLVLTGCGPVGVPGMPEWGMVPVPAKLAAQGVRDMVRVTDGRMSGTGFGTVFLHAAPESAVGGPLALVRTGDTVVVDVPAGRLDLDVPARELARRRAAWSPPPSPHLRGWPALYRRHVTQAPQGCDLDFLRAPTERHLGMVPPVIGRS
ncbi:dihydroxy-acid dehydratase [Kitasatospora sp. NPDC004723]|uniref:dihydroxy-acid dehydratase n=1 Tax=Kitasatospora sp. NPDC004723 TaxID=3154288 RepID=UPI0033A53FAA